MEKVKPSQFKVHPRFRDLIIEIQNERVLMGMETARDRIPLWRLTKTISNLIDSNPEIKKSLVEVKINV